MPRGTLFTAAGLIGTVVGAYVLVTGAEGVIDALDSSGGFVGLTVVALGRRSPSWSLPCSRPQGPGPLLAGNVLGSNISNSLGGGGLVAAGLMVAVVLLSWAFLPGGPARSGYAVALPFMKG